jgi:hypothetical protein
MQSTGTVGFEHTEAQAALRIEIHELSLAGVLLPTIVYVVRIVRFKLRLDFRLRLERSE